MKHPGYGKNGREIAHRIASGAVVLAMLWGAYGAGGFPLAVKAMVFCGLPLCMIWFPDVMSRLHSDGWSARAGWHFSFPVTAGIVRFFGWFALVGVSCMWLLFAGNG